MLVLRLLHLRIGVACTVDTETATKVGLRKLPLMSLHRLEVTRIVVIILLLDHYLRVGHWWPGQVLLKGRCSICDRTEIHLRLLLIMMMHDLLERWRLLIKLLLLLRLTLVTEHHLLVLLMLLMLILLLVLAQLGMASNAVRTIHTCGENGCR